LNPNDFWTQVTLARSYRGQRRYADADAAYRKALTAPSDIAEDGEVPITTRRYVLIGEEATNADRNGDTARALELWSSRVLMSRQSVGWQKERAPDNLGAESMFGRQLARDLLSRARTHLSMEEYPEALIGLRESMAIRTRITDIDPDPARLLEREKGRIMLAQALWGDKQFEQGLKEAVDAANHLQRLVTENPKYTEAVRDQGLATLSVMQFALMPDAKITIDEASYRTLFTISVNNAAKLVQLDPSAANWEMHLDFIELRAKGLTGINRNDAIADYRLMSQKANEFAALYPDLARVFVARSAYHLTKLQAPEVDWKQTAELFEKAAKVAPLSSEDETFLREARAAVSSEADLATASP